MNGNDLWRWVKGNGLGILGSSAALRCKPEELRSLIDPDRGSQSLPEKIERSLRARLMMERSRKA